MRADWLALRGLCSPCVAAAGVRANSACLHECAIALQRHARAPTPRTYASAPSRCSGMRTGQLRALTRMPHRIALQRTACGPTPRAYTNALSYRVAAACAHAVLRMGFSRRRCPRVYAPCVSPCRVFARSAVSALCRPCAVRQTPLSRAATDAPCSGCACQSSTGHTFRIPP